MGSVPMPQSLAVATPECSRAAALEEVLLRADGISSAVTEQVMQWKKLLATVRETGSVAIASETLGVPRATFYRVWRQHRSGGDAALVEAARRSVERSPSFRNQVDALVLRVSDQFPAWGRQRISKHLAEAGYDVSPRQVWCVWKRYDRLCPDRRIGSERERTAVTSANDNSADVTAQHAS